MRKNSIPSVELNSMYNWHIKRIPLDFKCLIWQAKKVTVRYIHRVTLNYKKFLSVIPTYVNANDYFCLKNIPKSYITEKKNVFVTTIIYLSCINFRQKEVQIVQIISSLMTMNFTIISFQESSIKLWQRCSIYVSVVGYWLMNTVIYLKSRQI